MKKSFAMLIAMCFAISAFAFNPAVNEKVLRSFNQTFTAATEVIWEEHDNYYAVSFVNNGIRSKVRYDKDGVMTNAIRYYDPSMLPLNVLNTLKKAYPARELFGVTEVSAGINTVYYVKMQDARFWYTIQIDPSGNTRIYEKYKKA